MIPGRTTVFGVVLTVTIVMFARPADAAQGRSEGVERRRFVVRETAGIRRFGYPVTLNYTIPTAKGSVLGGRLLDQGKPIAAQFSSCPGTHGRTEVSVDFAPSLGPFETREYMVEVGDIPGGPRTGNGITVDRVADAFHIRSGRELIWEVPADLRSLLKQVRTPELQYLTPGSAGLMIRYKDNIHFRCGGRGPYGAPTAAQVTKAGPWMAAIRFEGIEPLRGGRQVPSRVELEFPRTKSWIRVDWTVDDPNQFVAGLGCDLSLNIRGEPTLVDFGAGSFVYAALRKGQAARFISGIQGQSNLAAPAWQTFVGPADNLSPYVVAERGARSNPAEGWAHVMDKERCTAISVKDFTSGNSASEIRSDASGRLQIWKNFAQGGASPPAGAKRLVFWLHFVPMPVHLGAATSPQSMLAPLEVMLVPE